MLPWLQRLWRTGQLRSTDGGEQMCFKSRCDVASLVPDTAILVAVTASLVSAESRTVSSTSGSSSSSTTAPPPSWRGLLCDHKSRVRNNDTCNFSWNKRGTVRHRQSKEASRLRSHHEETRKLPGERDNARNIARCTQARKTTHGLGGQHQDVDRSPRGRVDHNDRGQR